MSRHRCCMRRRNPIRSLTGSAVLARCRYRYCCSGRCRSNPHHLAPPGTAGRRHTQQMQRHGWAAGLSGTPAHQTRTYPGPALPGVKRRCLGHCTRSRRCCSSSLADPPLNGRLPAFPAPSTVKSPVLRYSSRRCHSDCALLLLYWVLMPVWLLRRGERLCRKMLQAVVRDSNPFPFRRPVRSPQAACSQEQLQDWT